MKRRNFIGALFGVAVSQKIPVPSAAFETATLKVSENTLKPGDKITIEGFKGVFTVGPVSVGSVSVKPWARKC